MSGQNSGFPPGVAEKIAAMGATFDEGVLGATRGLYVELVKRQDAAAVEIIEDLAYGPDARQKLDVYRPQGRRLPVLVYVPGGGFVGGDKNVDGVYYKNIGTYFAKRGMLVVVANYRLAPAHPWPAGAADVGGAVAWVRANAETHGGDPNRVFLWGQSAGSCHAANYLFDPQFHPKEGVGVTAGILMSGPYHFTAGPGVPPNIKAYLGDDMSLYEARSPQTHVGKSKVPLLLSVAEYDPPFLAVPTFELARAVTWRDGRSPRFVWQKGHNHVSTVQCIGSGQEDVTGPILDFIHTFTA